MKKRKEAYWGLMFASPYILNILVFFLLPLLFSVYLTFTRYDMFNPPKWVGFTNWIYLLKDRAFWKAIRNTAVFALLDVPFQTALAMTIAYILNKSIKGIKVFRVLYFIPVISPWVGVGMMWLWLYNKEYGLLNWMLGLVGLGPYSWINSQKWVVVVGSIALVSIWKSIGYSMVLFLAGLQNISTEMIEASMIDGANSRQRFFKIIFPCISPTTFMVLILSTISAFQVFDAFFVMLTSQGGMRVIQDDFNVANVLIYDNAFLFSKMGYASAMAWVLFAIIAIFSLIQNKLEKRWVQYD